MGALCERAIRRAVDQLEDTQDAEKELVDGIEEEICLLYTSNIFL